MLAAKPDAVLLGGSATQGALPPLALAERGYKGPLYGTPALLNADFVRVGGKAVEGVLVSAGTAIVGGQLAPKHFIQESFLGIPDAHTSGSSECPTDRV